MVWTADSSSLTSDASARSVTIVTERSPLATRLAIAPAARTGSVTRRLSQRDSHRSTPTATASTASRPMPRLRSVALAVAYARAVGWRNTIHQWPWSAGTVITSSWTPRAVRTTALRGRSTRWICFSSGSSASNCSPAGATSRWPCSSTTSR